MRQCATWSYTAITAHRKLRKGILYNPVYSGTLLWNRSRWLRHPVTGRYTYRVRPQDDWISRDAPELRIVPQDLWDFAQTRLAARGSAVAAIAVGGKFRRYWLSGFLKCGICGGNYIITIPFSYRCGTFRNRGSVACTNHFAISRRRLERTVVDALRDRLYGEENLRDLVDRVREILRARARQHAMETRVDDRAMELRRLEREIEHIKRAVRLGKATSTLLGMLEEAERRRAGLLSSTQGVLDDSVTERLARVLDRLPEIVSQHLADLERLLTTQQVDHGKAILAALGTKITLHPCEDRLEARAQRTQ